MRHAGRLRHRGARQLYPVHLRRGYRPGAQRLSGRDLRGRGYVIFKHLVSVCLPAAGPDPVLYHPREQAQKPALSAGELSVLRLGRAAVSHSPSPVHGVQLRRRPGALCPHAERPHRRGDGHDDHRGRREPTHPGLL